MEVPPPHPRQAITMTKNVLNVQLSKGDFSMPVKKILHTSLIILQIEFFIQERTLIGRVVVLFQTV